MTMNIHAAKTNFSKLVERASEGEEIIIARAGKPVCRLVPIKKTRAKKKRIFGQDQGKFKVPDNFNDPMPESFMRYFK